MSTQPANPLGPEGLARVARIRAKMAAARLDAFYLRGTTNIAWATGFQGVFDSESAHALLITPTIAYLHTDSRYVTAFKQAAAGTGFEIDDVFDSHFGRCLQRMGLKRSDAIRVGIEDTISLREFRTLQTKAKEASADVSLVETANFVETLRATKDEAELSFMRKAQAITDAGFAHIVDFMQVGMTEREVQLELDRFMLDAGAQGLAFDTIVATGAHGASPHAQPGETVLQEGDAVVMDFGARYGGYCSDMTRTVFMGEPSDTLKSAWETMRRANEECEALIKSGVTGRFVHDHAEAVLAEGGFGGRMGHSLGHSVGLDIHEAPNLSSSNNRPLPAGAVVTVEPGIYLEGEFGMRLEDFGVVTDEGYEVLTKSTHDMVIIGVRE